MTEPNFIPKVPGLPCGHKVRDEKGALLRCAETVTVRTKVDVSLSLAPRLAPAIEYHFWCAYHVPADEELAPTTDEEMADG